MIRSPPHPPKKFKEEHFALSCITPWILMSLRSNWVYSILFWAKHFYSSSSERRARLDSRLLNTLRRHNRWKETLQYEISRPHREGRAEASPYNSDTDLRRHHDPWCAHEIFQTLNMSPCKTYPTTYRQALWNRGLTVSSFLQAVLQGHKTLYQSEDEIKERISTNSESHDLGKSRVSVESITSHVLQGRVVHAVAEHSKMEQPYTGPERCAYAMFRFSFYANWRRTLEMYADLPLPNHPEITSMLLVCPQALLLSALSKKCVSAQWFTLSLSCSLLWSDMQSSIGKCS